MDKAYYQIKGYRDAIDVLCQSEGFPLSFKDIRGVIRIDRPRKKYYSLSITNNYKVFTHFQSIEGRDGAYLSITLLIPFDKRVSPAGKITSELHALQLMMKDFEDLYLDEDFEIKKIRIDNGIFQKTIDDIKLEADSTHIKFESTNNNKFGLIKYEEKNQLEHVFQKPFFRELSNYQEVFLMSPEVLDSYRFDSLITISDPTCFHSSYTLKIIFRDGNGDDLPAHEIQKLVFTVKINGNPIPFQNPQLVSGLKEGDEIKVKVVSDKWELNSSGFISFYPSDPRLLESGNKTNIHIENSSSIESVESYRSFVLSLIPKEYRKKFRIINGEKEPIAGVSVELIARNGAVKERMFTNSQGFTDYFILQVQSDPHEFKISKHEYELKKDRLSIQDIKLEGHREIILSPKKYKVVLTLLNPPANSKNFTLITIKDDSRKSIHGPISFSSKIRQHRLDLPKGYYSIFQEKSKKPLKTFSVFKSNTNVSFTLPDIVKGPVLPPELKYYGFRVVVFLAFLVFALSIYHYQSDIIRVGKYAIGKVNNVFSGGGGPDRNNGVGEVEVAPINGTQSEEETSSRDKHQSTLDSIIDFANSVDFDRRRIEKMKIKLADLPEEYREELKYSNLLHGSNPMQNANYEIVSNRLSHMYGIAGDIDKVDQGNPNNTKNEYCRLISYYGFRLSKKQNTLIESKFRVMGDSDILGNEWEAWRDENCK